MTNQLDRETWLTECAQFILDDIISEHATLPTNGFRISIGFPTERGSRNVIASCWKREASADGVNEIFVTPTEDDSLHILGALTHELVHYVDNCESGHKGAFAALARAIGLKGKMTEALPGDELNRRLAKYVELLGDIPHARLDVTRSGKKKQQTRMIKVSCDQCGWQFRTTAKHIDAMKYFDCQACENGTLEAESHDDQPAAE